MRSPTSIRAMLPLCILLFTSTASAASAVLGIDLGTNFIKAAIVKPGTPLDIVLTKDSRRKEASALAFKPSPDGPVEVGYFPERLYGADALALAARFPGDVYANLKPLLGLSDDETAPLEAFTSAFPALQAQQEQRPVSFKSAGAFSTKEQPWTVEELLAIQLKGIRANAEAMSGKGSKITDAVITVPAFYTAAERRAVERAADMAGIKVMALISDGLAVGIDYSVKREFPNVSRGGKAEYHLVFDMGATSTTATVLRFQARDVKTVGKFNNTIQEVAVVGTGFDRALGGNALNALILDHLVNEFVEKPQAKSASISASDVKEHGRTASKLWKESERARQVLSANAEVRSSFEGLYQDIDFSSKLTRAQFEELAASFAARVEAPVTQALEAAKLSISDLESVILHGGAVRTPFVQQELEKVVGKAAEIRSNVNPDESAAFGAAFKAAGLSSSFRVKEIRDSEAAIYAAGLVTTSSGKEKQQQIFVPTSLSGTPKQVQVKDKADTVFDIYQKVDGKDRVIFKAETTNLTAGVKVLHDKFGCAEDEIATKLSLRLSPLDTLPEILEGTISCSVDASKKGGLVDSVKGLFGGKKAEQEPLKDEAEPEVAAEASTSSSAAVPEVSASKKANKTETAKTTRTETINIAFKLIPVDSQAPSKEEYARMIERLAAFDRSDNARAVREEASNTLESFIYSARHLLDDVAFEAASTEAIRTQISDLLSSTSDWLYEEGPSATTAVLKEKLSALTSLIDPIKTRQKEAKGRPDQIKGLKSALDQTKTFIDMIGKEVAKAAAEASSAVSDAVSTASSAVVSEASSVKDDLEDLEEPETATSTSSSAKASPTPEFPTYTQDDLDSLQSAYNTVTSWLEEKLAAQEKLPSYEDAVLTIKDIEERTKSLEQSVMNLLTRSQRTPPYKKASSTAKKSASAKAKSAKAAASSAAAKASAAAKQSKEDVEESIRSAAAAQQTDAAHDEL